MANENPLSITDLICTCGCLPKLSKCNEIPIVYSKEAKQFRFEWTHSDGVQKNFIILHHCPACGGVVPEMSQATSSS